MTIDSENTRSKNVGKNLTSLLEQTGITITGFSYGAGISLNHARRIKNGKASISSKTAGKIADFFDIEAGLLFLSKNIKLKDPLKIPSIAIFYSENIQNDKFFTARAKDDKVAVILKDQLIHEEIMSDWTRSNQIVEYVKKSKKYQKYKHLFNIRNVSKAFGRIYESTTLLDRNDMRGNGKVFQYKKRIGLISPRLKRL